MQNLTFQTCCLISLLYLGPSDQMSSSSVSLYSTTTTYICTVTVTASDVYGGEGSELVCPTKPHDPVTVTMQSKACNIINEIIIVCASIC